MLLVLLIFKKWYFTAYKRKSQTGARGILQDFINILPFDNEKSGRHCRVAESNYALIQFLVIEVPSFDQISCTKLLLDQVK